MSKANDLFEKVTNDLIAMIEDGETSSNWEKPWKGLFGNGLPTNFTTKNQYQGFNTFALMLAAFQNDYPAPYWATYRQWASIDGQVRKGEKGTLGVKWGATYTCTCGKKGPKPCETHPGESDRRMWASTFVVFNVAQVDGVTLPELENLGTEVERLEHVEEFVKALGPDLRHVAGDKAYFVPATDKVTLPLREQFKTQTGYYGTLLHELTHWTGHKDRLDRDLSNAFGTHKYAAEELVAEIGSALLAAHFGIEAVPHVEHATYLKGWLKALKEDPMHLYRAAKLANQAADWMLEKADVREVVAV